MSRYERGNHKRMKRVHARALAGVAKSQSPLKAGIFKSQQPCPSTVSLDLDPLLHSLDLDPLLAWLGPSATANMSQEYTLYHTPNHLSPPAPFSFAN